MLIAILQVRFFAVLVGKILLQGSFNFYVFSVGPIRRRRKKHRIVVLLFLNFDGRPHIFYLYLERVCIKTVRLSYDLPAGLSVYVTVLPVVSWHPGVQVCQTCSWGTGSSVRMDREPCHNHSHGS